LKKAARFPRIPKQPFFIRYGGVEPRSRRALSGRRKKGMLRYEYIHKVLSCPLMDVFSGFGYSEQLPADRSFLRLFSISTSPPKSLLFVL
jgi:hypothetical protein